MTEFLREWATQITGVIIFSSLCEIIIPGGSIKKYIHIVLGMLLILTVIRPISTGIGSDEDIFGGLERYNAYTSHINMDEIQREQVIRLYGDKLNENIESTVNSVSGIESVEVKAELATDSINDFGEIEELEVIVECDDDRKIDEVYKVIQNTYGLDKDNIEIRGR